MNSTASDIPKRKEVCVLMSANDAGITSTLTMWVQAGIGQKYPLQITETPFSRKLLEHAENNPVDIFIFVLNNMIIDEGVSDSAPLPLRKALKLVSEVKAKYKKPVIAMAGWPSDPAFSEEVRKAGADYFFPLPFPGPEFQETINRCMNIPQ
jgi:hypothetical protein